MPRLISIIGEAARDVVDNGLRLVARLNSFSSKVNVDEVRQPRLDELNVHISRVSEVIERLGSFMDFNSWDESIHYLDIEKLNR